MTGMFADKKFCDFGSVATVPVHPPTLHVGCTFICQEQQPCHPLKHAEAPQVQRREARKIPFAVFEKGVQHVHLVVVVLLLLLLLLLFLLLSGRYKGRRV